MTKSDLEFFDVSHVDWVPVEGNPGQHQRILAGDPHSGVVTRILRFDPGTDTTRSGVLRHDFWGEMYIVSGELYNLTLDRVFGAGSYACRPPGMPHGPWVSDQDALPSRYATSSTEARSFLADANAWTALVARRWYPFDPGLTPPSTHPKSPTTTGLLAVTAPNPVSRLRRPTKFLVRALRVGSVVRLRASNRIDITCLIR